MEDALISVFPNAKIQVAMDLLAAARALLGTKAGFAAILGTGTNTCIYDGRAITQHVDSLGFILGDEGSGGAMGKRLLNDYIRKAMPENLSVKFSESYRLNPDEIIDRVYTQPMPNRFCASFSKFIFDNRNEEYSQNLVKIAFFDFFTNLVSRYPAYRTYTFNCIGSVAYNFKDILEDTAKQFGMAVGEIVRSPIEGLTNYHLAESSAIKLL